MTNVPGPLVEALAGRYRIERELGSGGMAIVYLAEDVRHKRLVAIKAMRPELAHAAGSERFRREVEIAAGLSHPRILPLIDSGIAGELMWFAMPYVEGGSLRSRLKRDGPLPIAEAVLVARGVAGALSHAHRHGVIHRDVKPENILLMDGEPLLSDFGLAHLAAPPPGPKVTMTGMTLGTPGYMSPEQYSGGAVDARTDVYNLGCVLYEMLAGQPPFTGPSAEVVAFQHLNAAPPDVRQLRPLVPESLARAIQRAMAKLAVDRFATADDFRRAIEDTFSAGAAANVAAANALTQEAMPPVAGTIRRPGASWRRSRLLVAAVVLALAAAAIVAWRVVPGFLPRQGEPAADATADSRPLVVLPFVGDLPAGSRPMVADVRTLLTNILDDYDSTRCVDSRYVDQAIRAEKSAPTNAASARRLADRLGAVRLVQGSIVLIGHRVRLDARLALRSGGRDTSVATSAEGDVDSLSRVVEVLARAIIASSLAGTDRLGLALAVLDTPPLEALQAFQAAGAEPSLASAVDLYARATQIDSNFALAWVELATTQSFLGQSDQATRSIERSLELGGRLPLRERLRLEARLALLRVEVARAEQLYRQLLAEYPDDAAAWMGLGDEFFVYNTLRGRRTLEARQPYLEAVRLDPSLARDVTFRLERIGMAIGDVRWVDSLYRASASHEKSGDENTAVATWLAFARDDAKEQSAMLKQGSANTPEQLWSQMQGAVIAGNVGAGLQFGRMAVAQQVEPSSRAFTQLQCAIYAVSGGRVRQAREFLRAADATDSVYARSLGGLIMVSGFIPASPAELDSLRRALMRLADTPKAEERMGSPRFVQIEGAVQPIRLYVLGLIAVRMGRVAEARGLATRLARVDGSVETRVWAHNYSAGILAALDARAALWPDALARLSRLSLGTKPGGRMVFHNLLQERFLHGEVLRASGDLRGALAWYECMSDLFIVDNIYSGPCRLAAAEVFDQLGRKSEAIQRYRLFCKLWRECDPEFRPVLERATQRLAVLEAQDD